MYNVLQYKYLEQNSQILLLSILFFRRIVNIFSGRKDDTYEKVNQYLVFYWKDQ